MEKLTWRYPYEDCVDIPSKLTATQIKGRVLDQEAAEEAVGAKAVKQEGQPIYRPHFMTEAKGLTPAQRGTALHLAMQYIPLEGDHTAEGIRTTLDRLAADSFLTRLQREAVPPESLSAFFLSPLGRAMVAARECQREFKFSILVPAQDYYPGAEQEEILLQGVIDAWFDNGDGVTVVDFKSDRIVPGGEAARAEEYRPQLEAYSKALSAILDRPVQRKVLWFFATGTQFEL